MIEILNKNPIKDLLISDGKSVEHWKILLVELIGKNSTNIIEIVREIDSAIKNNTKIDLIFDILDFIFDYGGSDIMCQFTLVLNEIFHFNTNKGLKLDKQTDYKYYYLIQKWANSYSNIVPKFQDVYKLMKSERIKFPPIEEKINTYLNYIKLEEIEQIKHTLNLNYIHNENKTMFFPDSEETNFQEMLKNSSRVKSVEIISDLKKEIPKKNNDINNNNNYNEKIYMNNGNLDTEAFPNNNINSSKKNEVNSNINNEMNVQNSFNNLKEENEKKFNNQSPINLEQTKTPLHNIDNNRNTQIYLSDSSFHLWNNSNNHINSKIQNKNTGNEKNQINNDPIKEIKSDLHPIKNVEENNVKPEKSIHKSDNSKKDYNNVNKSNINNNHESKNTINDSNNNYNKNIWKLGQNNINNNNKYNNNEYQLFNNKDIKYDYYIFDNQNKNGMINNQNPSINNNQNTPYNKDPNISHYSQNQNVNNSFKMNRSNSNSNYRQNGGMKYSYLNLFDLNYLQTKVENETKKLSSWIDEGFFSFHNTFTGNLKKGIDNLKNDLQTCEKIINHYQNDSANFQKVNIAKKLRSKILDVISKYDKLMNDNKNLNNLSSSCMVNNTNNYKNMNYNGSYFGNFRNSIH